MKDSGQSQQFNTTFILAMILAGLLALLILGLIYGCMKYNGAAQPRIPHAGVTLHGRPGSVAHPQGLLSPKLST